MAWHATLLLPGSLQAISQYHSCTLISTGPLPLQEHRSILRGAFHTTVSIKLGAAAIVSHQELASLQLLLHG